MREQFQQVRATRHEYAKKWKQETGGKVIGYFCSYMPEEIAYAAGILPVRLIPDGDLPTLSEVYMAAWTCPFTRGVLQAGLSGSYDYLDGLVMPMTCFHTYSAYDNWLRNKAIPFSYRINLPKVLDREGTKEYYVGELREFQHALEGLVGRKISDHDLEKATKLLNTNRRLMWDVYSLRKGTPPLLSGTEALEMVIASQLMHKEEHNRLVSQWLKELPRRQDKPQAGERLMIVGSVMDKPLLLELVEGEGFNIVIDDMCTGTRYFWNEVELVGEDPMQAIATRYVERNNCPCKIAWDRRYQNLLKLYYEYQAHGVLIAHQKFCMPHGNDLPRLERIFKEKGIPSFFLEVDTTISEGQVRTRAQAFLEMLELEVV